MLIYRTHKARNLVGIYVKTYIISNPNAALPE